MRIALLLIAAVALLPACGGDDIPGPDGGDDNPAPDGGDDNPAPDERNFLVFTVQPSSTAAGQVMAPAVEVSVKDAAGKLLTSSTAAITLYLNTPGPRLNGQTTHTATNGVAVFSDLSITRAASSYSLSATASGEIAPTNAATSTGFAILPGPATAIVIHDGDGQVVARGATVPRRPAVLVTDQYNNRVAGVSVAFEVVSGGGTVDGAQATTGADGVAAVTSWTLGSSPGPNTLRATAATLTGSPVIFTATAVEVGVKASGILAFTTRRWNLALINPDGTNTRTLTTSTPEQNDFAAAWSPDGTRIAFARSVNNSSLAIHIINSDGTNLVRLSPAGALDDTPAWSPDGHRIAFTNQDLQDPSPTGTQVWVMNADGTNRVRLTTLPQGAGWPAWSPDGKIAFGTGTGVNEGDIYVMDADGSDMAILTNHVGRESDPKWSPDGRRIVYSHGAYPANSALFVIDANGTNRRQLTSPPLEQWSYSDYSPAWSRDGQWIVFNRRYDCDPWRESGGPACVPEELRVTSSSGEGFLSSFLTHGHSASWGP